MSLTLFKKSNRLTRLVIPVLNILDFCTAWEWDKHAKTFLHYALIKKIIQYLPNKEDEVLYMYFLKRERTSSELLPWFQMGTPDTFNHPLQLSLCILSDFRHPWTHL